MEIFLITGNKDYDGCFLEVVKNTLSEKMSTGHIYAVRMAEK